MQEENHEKNQKIKQALETTSLATLASELGISNTTARHKPTHTNQNTSKEEEEEFWG